MRTAVLVSCKYEQDTQGCPPFYPFNNSFSHPFPVGGLLYSSIGYIQPLMDYRVHTRVSSAPGLSHLSMISFTILDHIYSVYLRSIYRILMVSKVLQKICLQKISQSVSVLATDGKQSILFCNMDNSLKYQQRPEARINMN